jgi:Site-specific recombinase XerD
MLKYKKRNNKEKYSKHISLHKNISTLLRELLQMHASGDYTQKRNALILKILLCTGLRRAEISNIKVKDISIQEKDNIKIAKIIYRAKKRFTKSTLFLGPKTTNWLIKYLLYPRTLCYSRKKQKREKKKQSGYIFPSSRQIYNIVQTHLSCSVHSLRKTYINHLRYNVGLGIEEVSKIAGHKGISTTQLYLDNLPYSFFEHYLD